MCQNLAGLGLKLHDISGRRATEAVDQDRVLTELRDASVPVRQLAWLAHHPIATFDRVLVARDSLSGRCQGVMLVNHMTTRRDEPFLMIESLTGAPLAHAEALLQRMVTFLILRLETMEARPAAILARTRDPLLCRVLHAIGQRIAFAACHPASDGNVVHLHIAALAHRLARAAGSDGRFQITRPERETDTAGVSNDGPMLAALDLRQGADAHLIEEARKLFRTRVPRAARRQTGPVVLPMARHAG